MKSLGQKPTNAELDAMVRGGAVLGCTSLCAAVCAEHRNLLLMAVQVWGLGFRV
jgi:hypothetical protein